MKISIINFSENSGGAGRAANRLFTGLKKYTKNSVKMFVKNKTTKDEDVLLLKRSKINYLYERYFNEIQEKIIRQNRTKVSNTIMNYPFYGYNLLKNKFIQESDIINLHWINMFQSIESIELLIKSGKQVVWTMHDEWPYTGGCHYTAGCKKYTASCLECPQLESNPKYTELVLNTKIKAFKNKITVVTPSKWLADNAKKSAVFKNSRVEVIPNSVNTRIFKPINKLEAKKSLGIPEDSVSILFGAENHKEKRKGFDKLLEAMKYVIQNSHIIALIKQNKLNIVTFGNPNEDIKKLNIPVKSMGYVREDEKLVLIYSASDFVILPSIEDNLPNIILEAMACGTPVLGFNIGGLPDIITDTVGQTVKAFDTYELAAAIISHILNKEMLIEKQKNSIKHIQMNYRLENQAQKYQDLFDSILVNKKTQFGLVRDKYFIESKIFSSTLKNVVKISKIRLILSFIIKKFLKR